MQKQIEVRCECGVEDKGDHFFVEGRYAIYKDNGVIYDTINAADIPQHIFEMRDKLLAKKDTIMSLASKIFEGAKNLEVLINQNPLDLLRTDAPSAKECPECGMVYFKGEDNRVDAGMKCGNCAYRI